MQNFNEQETKLDFTGVWNKLTQMILTIVQYVLRVVYTVLGAELDECKCCEFLKESLEYERERNEELQRILLQRSIPQTEIPEDEPAEQTFKAIRPKRVPFSTRRRELELRHRKERTETNPTLTEAEEIFEKELNSAG